MGADANRPWNKKEILAAAGLAGGALGLYLWTLAPTVAYQGDGGELTAAAYVLGNAHPTGYPLFLILGKLFSWLPWGDVAHRLNLLSAVCASATVVCLFMALRDLTGDGLAAGIGSASLALSYQFWSQALRAEVYTLQTFFFAFLLWLHGQWLATRHRRWAYAVGLAYGWGAANHVSLVPFLPFSLLFLILTAESRKVGLKTAGACVWWLIPGLLLYLYLPLRASTHPPLNWGNPVTLSRFLDHVTARSYRAYLFAQPLSEVGLLAWKYGVFWARQFFPLWLLAPLGAFCLWRQARPLAWWGAALAGLNVGFYLNYDVGDRANYFLPTYVLTAWLIGLGAHQGIRWVNAHVSRTRRLMWPLVGVCLMLGLGLEGQGAAGSASLRGHDHARRHAEAILRAVPAGARLWVESDEVLFSLWYLQHVEAQRPELKIVSLSDLTRPANRRKMWRLIRANGDQQPVYVAFWDEELAGQFALWPRGPVCRLSREPERPRTWLAPAPERAEATFPDGLVLVRHAINEKAIKPLTLAEWRVEWYASRPPERTWQSLWLFVRRDNAAALAQGRERMSASGEALAFTDYTLWWAVRRDLGQGAWPTSGWPGQIHVEDRYSFSPPQTAVPGDYEVRLGLVEKGPATAARSRSDVVWCLQHTRPLDQVRIITR